MVSVFDDVVGGADDVDEEHGQDLWGVCSQCSRDIFVCAHVWGELWQLLVGDVEDGCGDAGVIEDGVRVGGEDDVGDGVGGEVGGGREGAELNHGFIVAEAPASGAHCEGDGVDGEFSEGKCVRGCDEVAPVGGACVLEGGEGFVAHGVFLSVVLMTGV